MFLLSRGFIVMLGASSLIALPITWLFFERSVLTRFPFHDPGWYRGIVWRAACCFDIAFIMIGSQTMRAASNNPAEILKCE
ncbi:MAG: hypothetical protein WDO15_00420 [Bacteroidota bacterium]